MREALDERVARHLIENVALEGAGDARAELRRRDEPRREAEEQDDQQAEEGRDLDARD